MKCIKCGNEMKLIQNSIYLCSCSHTILKQSKITSFVTSVVTHAKNKFQNVSPDLKSKRLDICKSCDKFNSQNTTCNECGCFLNIKTSWASEKCPLDKWLALTSDQMTASNLNTENSDCGCNKKNV